MALFIIKVDMRKLKDEIKTKNEQIALLENQIADFMNASHNKIDSLEISHVSLTFYYWLQFCSSSPPSIFS